MIPGATNVVAMASNASLEIMLAANETNVVLATKALAAGWDGVSAVNLSVTVMPAITISAATAADFAIDETGLVPGSNVNLTNNGVINGKGGAGGSGGYNSGNAGNGQSGGDAYNSIAGVSTVINNAAGEFNAGSGGNGGSAATRTRQASGNTFFCCGTFPPESFNCSNNTGAAGAAGGSLGQTGSNGSNGSSTTAPKNGSCVGCTANYNSSINCPTGARGLGGSPGSYIVGNSFVTWTANGIRRGSIS